MTKTAQIAAAARKDMAPQSPDHWVRIIFAGILVAAGCYFLVTHRGSWNNQDIGVLALLVLSGLGVAFTGSIVALLKAVPVPWRKNGATP